MKILAFVDIHGSLHALKSLEATVKKEKPDLLINLGDYTIFEQDIEVLSAKLARIHPVQLLIHSNHESQDASAFMAKRHGWTFLHKSTALVDDILFIGYGGGGFSTVDPAFERWSKTLKPKLKKAKKVVLLTHQPPHGTVLDHLWGAHVGNTSFTQFLKKHPVDLALSGHIHETATKTGKLGKTTLCNPGPLGKVFEL